MSMKINPITESFTCWAFDNITEMRNPSEEESTDNKCIALAKKGGRIILAEVAYLILPLVAIVEVVVRGIIALIATGLSYCSSNGNVQAFAEKAQDNVKGSGIAGVTSVAALVWNFTSEELEIQDMADTVFPCMKVAEDDASEISSDMTNGADLSIIIEEVN